MLNEFWGKLKSGSDIRGIAMEDDNNSKLTCKLFYFTYNIQISKFKTKIIKTYLR